MIRRKKKKPVKNDDLLDDREEEGGFFHWIEKHGFNLLVVIFSLIIVIVLSMVFLVVTTVEIADTEGEIVEIGEFYYKVIIKNVIDLQEGVSITNPVNLTVGVCFSEIYRDRCDVGTKVGLSIYRNLVNEWWYQDSIIKSYNQSL